MKWLSVKRIPSEKKALEACLKALNKYGPLKLSHMLWLLVELTLTIARSVPGDHNNKSLEEIVRKKGGFTPPEQLLILANDLEILMDQVKRSTLLK